MPHRCQCNAAAPAFLPPASYRPCHSMWLLCVCVRHTVGTVSSTNSPLCTLGINTVPSPEGGSGPLQPALRGHYWSTTHPCAWHPCVCYNPATSSMAAAPGWVLWYNQPAGNYNYTFAQRQLLMHHSTYQRASCFSAGPSRHRTSYSCPQPPSCSKKSLHCTYSGTVRHSAQH